MKKIVSIILALMLLLCTGIGLSESKSSSSMLQNEIDAMVYLVRYVYRGVLTYGIEMTIDPMISNSQENGAVIMLRNLTIFGGKDGLLDYVGIMVTDGKLAEETRTAAVCAIDCIENNPLAYSVIGDKASRLFAESILDELEKTGTYVGQHGFDYVLDDEMFLIMRKK